MAAVVSSAESAVREFAAQFATPNVLNAVALCESGALSWEAVEALFTRSLGAALKEVRA